MQSFGEFFAEMAAARDADKAKTYYHGMTDERNAQEILRSGVLVPGNDGSRKGNLAPVKGKVYITPHLHYGQIYAIGGDIAGSSSRQETGHGYLFTVKGEHLGDIQPDEDSVGEMAANKMREPGHHWLKSMAGNLNPSTQRRMKDGFYSQWASGGKQILRQMGDHHKHELIDAGAHIAHDGPVKIDQAWRIDKAKIPLLKRDGSNFFDHAERIR